MLTITITITIHHHHHHHPSPSPSPSPLTHHHHSSPEHATCPFTTTLSHTTPNSITAKDPKTKHIHPSHPPGRSSWIQAFVKSSESSRSKQTPTHRTHTFSAFPETLPSKRSHPSTSSWLSLDHSTHQHPPSFPSNHLESPLGTSDQSWRLPKSKPAPDPLTPPELPPT
jgi:hypothetical protein